MYLASKNAHSTYQKTNPQQKLEFILGARSH